MSKLVRDNIPYIIEASGGTCVTRVLDDEEYLEALNAKLDEELAEYHESGSAEELADLLEVIYAIAKTRGYDVVGMRIEKAARRGGFEKRIMLEEVNNVR